MDYSTAGEGPFTTTVPESSEPITGTSFTIYPTDTTIPTTTRFVLLGSEAIDIITTYQPDAAGSYVSAGETTITTTLSSLPSTETESSTETADATPPPTTTPTTTLMTTPTTTPKSESTRQASTTTRPTSGTQTADSDTFSQASSNGTSNGTLAGAIVGSIVGTALLTFLLAFLFFRRRRARPAAKELEHGVGLRSKSGATVSTAAMSSEKSNDSFSLAAIIPQPADDETVRSRILTIIDHASLHVDNYYGARSPSPQITQDTLARLAEYDSDYLPASLDTMLGQRGVSRKAITHALVYKLLQAIRPGGELLPKLLATQPQVGQSTASTEDALFAWRMVTAHLYNQDAYNKGPTHTAARDQAASSLAADFTAAFFPYALTTFSQSDRVSHLGKLAISTAELGIWLFSQPCTFEFVWNKSQDEFTVVPQVIKTFDEQGNRLPRPQVLIEAVQERYPSTV
ncbi:hypothetical protein BDV09DRAFT_205806 [Aspergillus tetrazonus]